MGIGGASTHVVGIEQLIGDRVPVHTFVLIFGVAVLDLHALDALEPFLYEYKVHKFVGFHEYAPFVHDGVLVRPLGRRTTTREDDNSEQTIPTLTLR